MNETVFELQEFFKIHNFTEKEIEIIQCLLADKYDEFFILNKLNIKKNTYNNHLKKIYLKAAVKGKFELIKKILYFLNDPINQMSTTLPKILIIDDNEDICKLLTSHFSQGRYDCQYLTDCKNILETVLGIYPDIIVMDINMPNNDGVELIKKLREKCPVRPYVIFITGGSKYSDQELYNDGAAYLLHKPFDLNDLQKNVDQILSLFSQNKLNYKNLDRYSFKDIEPGRGGCFIQGESLNCFKGKSLNTGQRFLMDLPLVKDDYNKSLIAEIAWSRPVAQESLKAGVGIRYLNFPKESFLKYHEKLMQKGIISFIPLGRN